MYKRIAVGLLLLVCGRLGAADYGPAQRESIEWCDIWIPHDNGKDAPLPRVLLIGDSITRGYYPAVESRLAGKAYVARLTTSAFISDPMLVQEIELVLDSHRFDVVQFNNGMHGWHHSEAEYAAALPRVLELIREHARGAKLIWANTTPLRGGSDATEPTAASRGVDAGKLMLRVDLTGRSNARVAARNAIALKLVAPLGFHVLDLNTLMQGHPEFYNGDVHFNARGIAVQADRDAAAIEAVLPAPAAAR